CRSQGRRARRSREPQWTGRPSSPFGTIARLYATNARLYAASVRIRPRRVTRVIFLAGLGRSGTTLLERALGEIPGLQPLGEVTPLWRRGIDDDELCGCGERFSTCPFWQAVGERAFGGWHNVDLGAIARARNDAERLWRVPELLLGPGGSSVKASARLIAESHRRGYDAAAAVSGANVVVDSSKHPALAYCLRSDAGIDLRVVHVVRDSRGVAYSWTKSVERPESTTDSS